MNAQWGRGLRRAVALMCAVLLGAAALQGISLSHSTPAQAADLGAFNRGNIIDDALFWDGNAMTEIQIQTFLDSKVAQCVSGYVCLKDYTETTHTITATPMCGQYDGQANESAARIIARIGQSCGLSPKAMPGYCSLRQQLLRLLQSGALWRLPPQALHPTRGHRGRHELVKSLRPQVPGRSDDSNSLFTNVHHNSSRLH
jgi:hypothetical protein